MGLNHSGYLPQFVSITDGKFHEVRWAKEQVLPPNSFVVFDKGFVDYKWYQSLILQGVFWVTRLKHNARYRVLERRPVNKRQGLLCDQSIRLTGLKGRDCQSLLRRIRYRDKKTGKIYVFVTSAFHLSAKTIADIYKDRWQTELFFKWIKQNLKIKTFLGTSKNAVLTQIWIALCIYLFLAWLKFKSRLSLSLHHMLRLLQLNLFERRDLISLLRGRPISNMDINPRQLMLLGSLS